MAAGDEELWESLQTRIGSGAGGGAGTSRVAVRPGSFRPDGLEAAGLHFADASLASTTGPVFNADDLPEGTILSPAQSIKGLYAAFNARDAACVASFLTDDCVYEDLLLGPATVCRGKAAFMGALRFHPAFVSSSLFDRLPFAKELLPALTLEVDSIAEGVDTVGVEWHVQCGETAFPLGRGLSQARVCLQTGKIERVVDIAEAPWRVIGLLVLPFINAVQSITRTAGGDDAAAGSSTAAMTPPYSTDADSDDTGRGDEAEGVKNVEREYELMMAAVLADGVVDPAERALLTQFAAEHAVSDDQHVQLLHAAGWSEQEYAAGARSAN